MMDDEDPAQQNAVGATWPPPPPFWMSFTPENLTRIEDLRQQAGSDGLSQAPSPPRLPGLPRELRNLQPPPEPQEAVWRLFGGNYKLVDELPKLEDQGVRRLFPDPADRDQDGRGFDRALILKRLAKSLLLNFVELTGILGARPDAAQEKISDIRDMLINFHHLINEYRPHQARESLIATMQAQLDRTRSETNAIRDAKEKVERVLEGLGSLKMDEADDKPQAPGSTPDQAAPAWMKDRDTWSALAQEQP